MKPIKGIYNLETPYGDIETEVTYWAIEHPEIVGIRALFFVDDEDDHRCNVKQWISEHPDACNEQLTMQILDECDACSENEFDPSNILEP